MKLLRTCALLVLLATFFGCTGGPEPAEDQQGLSDSQDAVEEPQYRTEVRYEHKILEERNFFSDGKLENVRRNEYDPEGRLLISRLESAEGDLLMESHFQYENDLLVREELFDGQGMISYTLYEYLDGLLTGEAYFDGMDNYLSGSKYNYNDDGLREFWIALDESQAPIMKTRYSYDGGLLARLDYMTPYDESEGYTIFSYEDGLLIKEASYNRQGDLEKKFEVDLQDGLPMVERNFFGSRLNRVNQNTFSEDDLLVRREIFNRSERLLQIQEFDYQEFPYEVQVLVE